MIRFQLDDGGVRCLARAFAVECKYRDGLGCCTGGALGLSSIILAEHFAKIKTVRCRL